MNCRQSPETADGKAQLHWRAFARLLLALASVVLESLSGVVAARHEAGSTQVRDHSRSLRREHPGVPQH